MCPVSEIRKGKTMAESSLKERIKAELLSVYEGLETEQCVDLLAAAVRIGKRKENKPAPAGYSSESMRLFLTFVETNRERLDHSCNPNVIAINLPHFREVVKADQVNLGIGNLPKFFKTSPLPHCQGSSIVRSRLWKKPVNCWIFDAVSFNENWLQEKK